MKYQIPQMLKQGGGAIVNTASTMGLVAHQNVPAYVASKHGVVGLTKSAAVEYATLGIRINCICPGVINTPLIAPNMKDRPHVEKGYIDMEPIGRSAGRRRSRTLRRKVYSASSWLRLCVT
jgi:NAD(P)-dependent dehydrogenase (short-subunit alcohol dehydrogenase family)